MDTVWKVLTRKKILDPITTEQSELGRVLNTFDLTALGVGSTLGVGVYVLAGNVAKNIAGPAVVLSFLIATVASVFAGLCYAEFGARAPRAGSAYIYSYVCVGEFVAFVIGWNLILEYVIGSASVARGLSLYLDTLLNNTLKDAFIDVAPIHVSFMSQYFDFLAFGISVFLSIALAFGMKESSMVNNIFTFLNLAVVVFVIIAGGIRANTDNWHVPRNTSDPNIGEGGFFPFGIEGMIKGAATCFYGFVGFDCVATTGEEVRNPKKAIPIAIVLSLFVIFLAYFGTSTVITLMIPYYNQDPDAPIPRAFEAIGWEIPKWIVAIGGIFGLCASLFGAMFPLPRIIYAMASDNLVFRFLGKVSSRFKTPVVGTLLAGLLTGLMAALFDLKELVNMMSIGTLLAYTIVAASVLLLRYEIDKGDVYEPLRALLDSEDNDTYTENSGIGEAETSEETELMASENSSPSVWKQIFNYSRQEYPTAISEKIVKWEVCIYCILCVLIGLCAMYLKTPISQKEMWAIILTAIVVCVTVLVVMSMATQPKSRKELSFKVPFVPLIPALSILVNIYLMLMLDTNTWIRFAVWMTLGIPTYYFSVQTHSDARNESLCSVAHTLSNGKMNGIINNGYSNDEIVTIKSDNDENTSKKKIAPVPPTLKKIEQETIAVLDEILEKEEASISNDRKFSVDSMSNASNVLREENVEADVHCADVPITPIQTETPPLVQSSDIVIPEPPPLPEITFDVIDLDTTTNQDDIETEPIVEINCVIPPPPPPPPLLLRNDEIKNVASPRPNFRNSDFTSVKLKHIEQKPATPPVDYSRQNSEVPKLTLTDDNIKFGTDEHKEFLQQLDQTLKQGYVVPAQAVLNFDKKIPVLITNVTSPTLPNEDVIEETINTNDAKEKLAQFYANNSIIPPMNRYNQIVKPKHNFEKKLTPTDEKNEIDYKEEHRRNMQNIFGSIKLRKEDSLKNDIPKPDTLEEKSNESPPPNNENNDNYKEKHRENMQTIFGSIKLRKIDSFKTDVGIGVIGTNDSKGTKDNENTENIFLKNIKLRKVNTFNNT